MRVNAQYGEDPALRAQSLSTRRFATEATRQAEMYRQFINDEDGVADPEDAIPPGSRF